MKRHAVAGFVCLVLPACSAAGRPAAGPAPAHAGRVVVDILPARDARVPPVRFLDLAAVGDDGSTHPLPLPAGFTPSTTPPPGERRLVSATLPPGRYTGLSARLSVAAPGGGPWVPRDEPQAVPVPFVVDRRRAAVVALRLEAGGAGGPLVAAETPPPTAPGLLGIVISRGPDEAALFDKVSGRVAGIVITGRGPSGLALDAPRRRAYVAAGAEDTVEAVGLLEQDVLGKLVLKGGDAPAELALTPDGRTLLSANEGSSTVSVIDALSLVETTRVPVGNGPRSLVVDRAGRRAYTFNTASSTLSVIDLAARAAAGTVAVEAGPLRGQFNRAGDRLYVIHRSSPYLSVVDPSTLTVVNRVYVGPGALALKVDVRTDRIYLARRGVGALEVFDPLSFLPVDTLPTDGEVGYLTIDDEANNLVLLLTGANSLQVVRIVGKETVARTETGPGPVRVALVGER